MSDTLQDLEEREYTRIGTANYGRGYPYSERDPKPSTSGRNHFFAGTSDYELLMLARWFAEYGIQPHTWLLCYAEYHRRAA